MDVEVASISLSWRFQTSARGATIESMKKIKRVGDEMSKMRVMIENVRSFTFFTDWILWVCQYAPETLFYVGLSFPVYDCLL